MKHKALLKTVAAVAILVLLFVAVTWADEPAFDENFESATPPNLPAGWTQETVSGTKGEWASGNATAHPAGQPAHGGDKLVYFNAYTAASGDSVRLYRVDSLDLSAVDGAQLSFWMYHDPAAGNDRLQAQVSTDGGSFWQDVGGPILRYDASAGWQKHSINFRAFMGPGYADTLIGFLGISDYVNDIYLDDIVFESVACEFGMCDSGEHLFISEAGLSASGGFFEADGGTLSLEPALYPPAMLTRQDYQDIYDEAYSLLDEGIRFRLCRLQLQTDVENYECPDDPTDPADDPTLDNYYANFNSGELLDAYCPGFDMDERGYCQAGIRNKLMESRRYFASLYLAEPITIDLLVNIGSGQELTPIQSAGLAGMLAATRELAYAHMIFGSEYAIDAFDYRFTIEGQAGGDCETSLERYKQKQDDHFADASYDYFADAECVIANELSLLEKSRQQYEFALEIMTSAYHDDLTWPKETIIGELFSQKEVEIFSVAIENYASVVDGIAVRERQLGGDGDNIAVALYAEAYRDLYVLTAPLLARADKLYDTAGADAQLLLNSNALAVRAGLDLLKGRVHDMENGLDPFGFTADYVPVQSYFHMRDISNGLFDWATQANNDAIDYTREFDVNATLLNAEMANVRNSYQSQLHDLCGEPEETPDGDPDNDYEACIGSGGSLMEQSWLRMASATLGMNLARQRIEAAYLYILDVQARNGQIITVKTATSQEIAAVTLAQGMAQAYQTTHSTINSISDQTYEEDSTTEQTVSKPGLLSSIRGLETPANDTITKGVAGLGAAGEIVRDFLGPSDGSSGNGGGVISVIGGAIGGAINSIPGGAALTGAFNALFGSTERSTTENHTTGKRHSETTTTSVSTVFNPSYIKIAELENVKAMVLLAQDVNIMGIEQDFEIRNQLRLIAELQIEKEMAANQYNQAAAEHNGLVKRWLYLKAQYKRAQVDLNANYLANPAYRLLKDHKTEVATYQLVYAAKQAYLSAKSLEYHMADQIPGINDAFKVRHPAHLRAYLQNLDDIYNISDQVAETTVEFSLRVIVSGISDQDISTAPVGERQALITLRQQRFLEYLQDYLIYDEEGNPDKLVLVFDTSLENRPINTTDRYHWRIAGAETGETGPSVDRCPVRKPYGMAVSILPGAQTLPNGMTVHLAMSGHTSTRKWNGEIVHYAPQLATLLSDESIPDSIRDTITEAVADASIDVNNPGNTISDFCNMPVAASSWILEIELQENQIDWSLFQDIKLKMWTFYFS